MPLWIAAACGLAMTGRGASGRDEIMTTSSTDSHPLGVSVKELEEVKRD